LLFGSRTIAVIGRLLVGRDGERVRLHLDRVRHSGDELDGALRGRTTGVSP
jgi:hypothetical protein